MVNSDAKQTENQSLDRSRFQVTPRLELGPIGRDLIQNDSRIEIDNTHRSSIENIPSIGDDGQCYQDLLFDSLDDNGNNNTITTTISSSSSNTTNNPFYSSTIYKYRKLKQNGSSSDTIYWPVYLRKSSTSGSQGSIKFYNKRVLVYNFLQRPTGALAIGYHIFVSIAIIVCLILTIMSTSSEYSDSVIKILNYIDYFIISFFIVEFLARLWSSECVSHYQSWKGKVRFFKNPIRIIDLFVIAISVAVLISNAKGELLITALRGARFVQIFQMVRLDFKFRPWRMMASVVYSQRIHLAIVFYMGFLALLFISFLIYFVEKDHNKDFDSLAASIWWSVITLCTIGYGDIYPQTTAGKLLACFCSLVGVSIFALPAGILGTGLALKVQEQQRQFKISKRKQPAARLIQCAWRLYKAEQELHHERKHKFCSGQSRRFIDHHLQKHQHQIDAGAMNENQKQQQQKSSILLDSLTIPSDGFGHHNRSIIWKRFEQKSPNKSRLFSFKERCCLNFLFSVKFCIAKRDFIKAFKPYDIKDVLEQYSAGHTDMLGKIRLMDNRLEKIQSNSSQQKFQNDLRFSFLNHTTKIEFEMQKIQTILSDLLQHQASSRVFIENLVRYLVEQQQKRCCMEKDLQNFLRSSQSFRSNSTQSSSHHCSPQQQQENQSKNRNSRINQIDSILKAFNYLDQYGQQFQIVGDSLAYRPILNQANKVENKNSILNQNHIATNSFRDDGNQSQTFCNFHNSIGILKSGNCSSNHILSSSASPSCVSNSHLDRVLLHNHRIHQPIPSPSSSLLFYSSQERFSMRKEGSEKLISSWRRNSF
ncbi:KCNQ potassium channel-like protein [Sarcoptes scabiei]|uniref:KCNQ potassium channel-like protein n=1 Tax=Sarcoptes scabiei TaxID=52283 RepID=A0A131ZTF8_SARSC|nr:KCNQ potassium channel-like protein [Sarcoptes scabiei]